MITFDDWGLVDFGEAYRRQLEVHTEVANGQSQGKVIFCRHPDIVTLGRDKNSRSGVKSTWTGQVIEIDRGGKATYHGPHQLMIYAILNLNYHLSPSRDVSGFIRWLESVIVRALEKFGIHAEGKSRQKNMKLQLEDATGVWVKSQKIASVGIGVKKWTTLHGAALCVSRDMEGFQKIEPCGFSSDTMVSMEELIGAVPDFKAVQIAIQEAIFYPH